MDAADFRRIALSFEGAEEGSHMGAQDFRVGGKIFATLASESQGYGNLMLSVEQQLAFVADQPDVFLPVPGGWGRMGATHIRLASAHEDLLTGALRTAWKLRVEKNQKAGKKKDSSTKSKKAKKPVRRNVFNLHLLMRAEFSCKGDWDEDRSSWIGGCGAGVGERLLDVWPRCEDR